METPHWTELGFREQLANRQEHLIVQQHELAEADHPIDIENIQMSMNITYGVIEFCERYIELWPDKC